MTREEAIAELKCSIELTHFDSFTGETSEWLNEENQRYVDACNMAIKALEKEPCEDAVSRKAVVEYIKASDAELGHDSENEIVAEDILNMPSVTPTPKWIPCSERLPKADEYDGDVAKYYLVQNEYGDMMVARYTHSDYWEGIYQLKPISDEIVAWMPLPEPYKAEMEGEE